MIENGGEREEEKGFGLTWNGLGLVSFGVSLLLSLPLDLASLSLASEPPSPAFLSFFSFFGFFSFTAFGCFGFGGLPLQQLLSASAEKEDQ